MRPSRRLRWFYIYLSRPRENAAINTFHPFARRGNSPPPPLFFLLRATRKNSFDSLSYFQLELVIENLPTLSGQFLCAFTIFDKVLITNATRKSYGVNCTTPRTDLLPSIPPGQRKRTATDSSAREKRKRKHRNHVTLLLQITSSRGCPYE